MTTREERYAAARQERDAAFSAHPFDRSRTLGDDGLFEDEPKVPLLVAFAGGGDKLGIPPVEFFEAVTVPCRRAYVREFRVPFVPHVLGNTVADVVQSLRRRADLASRTVFAGSSIGATYAMLYGTLVGVDAVFGVNATTTLRPDELRSFGDRRYVELEQHMTPEFLDELGDLRALWQRRSGPPVLLHYPYRDDVLRAHAERLEEVPTVTLVPHVEYSPMHKLSDSGELGRILDDLLLGT